MTNINITATEPNNAPSQPTDGQQPGQQNQQQPGQSQQQNDQTNKDKPAQQK